ncbi:MAG: DUF87 domain-containing protein [Thermofilaceae archaeon]
MAGLRFGKGTAPRHPGGGSGSGASTSTTPSSLGAGRGFGARVAPTIKTLLEGGKHIAILGATGCGKTSLAKLLCSMAPRPVVPVVIDWDGEYTDLGLPIHEPPFMLPTVDIATLLSNLERPPDGGHGISFAVLATKTTSMTELVRELERLASGYGILASWAQAALARAAVIKKYFFFTDADKEISISCVYDLSSIPERERAIVQQALATALVIARVPGARSPLLLVIEEGAMGSTEHYLKDLVVLSRRRNIKLLWISQSLPPEELLPNFVLFLGDPGPLRHEWSRLLGLPLPRLGRGEFLAYDGKTVRKVRVT